MFKFKSNEIYDIMNLGALIFLTVEIFLLNKWNNKENLLVKIFNEFFKWFYGLHLKGNHRTYKIKIGNTWITMKVWSLT